MPKPAYKLVVLLVYLAAAFIAARLAVTSAVVVPAGGSSWLAWGNVQAVAGNHRWRVRSWGGMSYSSGG